MKNKQLIYIDSSAYLCLALKEKQWQWIQTVTAGAKLYTSTLFLLEVHRNLVRLSREGSLKFDDYTAIMENLSADRDEFVLKNVDESICNESEYPITCIPRSLDLVHLRTALWFSKQGIAISFLSLDQTQRLAATEMGLKLV